MFGFEKSSLKNIIWAKKKGSIWTQDQDALGHETWEIGMGRPG